MILGVLAHRVLCGGAPLEAADVPLVLKKGAFRFFFFPADRGEPPHVHVRSERREAKFWLEPFPVLARNSRFRPHELKEIGRLVQENQEYLLEAWNAFFQR